MKKGLITLFCIILTHLGMAQSAQSDSLLVEIEGTLTDMRQAQDDISFYTWSLYLTIEIENGWRFLMDSTKEKTDIKSLQKYCDNFNEKTLEFNKNAFHDQEDIKEFTGKVEKGEKVKIFVRQSSLEKFLSGRKCMIYMESVEKEN